LPEGKQGNTDEWHPQEGGTPAGRLLRSKSAESCEKLTEKVAA